MKVDAPSAVRVLACDEIIQTRTRAADAALFGLPASGSLLRATETAGLRCGTPAGSRAVDEYTGARVVRALPECRAVMEAPDIQERILKESS